MEPKGAAAMITEPDGGGEVISAITLVLNSDYSMEVREAVVDGEKVPIDIDYIDAFKSFIDELYFRKLVIEMLETINK